MGSSFIHLIRTDPNVFFLMAEWYSTVYVYHSFLIHSSNSSFFKCQKVVLTQMSKLRYIYTMKYYSVIKKDEVAIYASTWMNFENVMLNETSQTQRSHTVWFHEYENVQNRQIHRDTK